MSTKYPGYVKRPVKCLIRNAGNQFSSRKLISVNLDNIYKKKMLFILMNPSKANENHSDKTINKCADITFNKLGNLKIGQFSVMNVYPFYQSDSAKLEQTLINVKVKSRSFFYREVFKNLQLLEKRIKSVDYVMLATGGIPNAIEEKEEYQFILDTILSFIEVYQGKVYLGSSVSYHGKYVYKEKYSYHICPKGNPNKIDRIKLHRIIGGKFKEIDNESDIFLNEEIVKE